MVLNQLSHNSYNLLQTFVLFSQALSPDGERLYVCDTNNHEIKVVDLKTLETSSVRIFERIASDDEDDGPVGGGAVVRMELDASAVTAEVCVKLAIPEGSKLNSDAPNSWTASVPGNGWSFEIGSNRGEILKPEFSIKFRRDGGGEWKTEETVTVRFSVYLCKKDSGVCYVVKKTVNLVLATQSVGKSTKGQQSVLNLDLSK